MNHSTFVVAVVVVAAIVITSAFALSAFAKNNNSSMLTLPGSEIQFTNQTVYLFGYSQNTEFIIDRLHLSTSNVTLVTSTNELSNLTGRFVLFIDCMTFLNSYNNSMVETAKAVEPIILNGAPTILLNRSMDFFSFAAPGVDFSYGESSVDGRTIIPLINGVKLVPGSTSASTWGLNWYNDKFDQSITAAYNWGVRNLDAPSP
jgi:hypothetical protein